MWRRGASGRFELARAWANTSALMAGAAPLAMAGSGGHAQHARRVLEGRGVRRAREALLVAEDDVHIADPLRNYPLRNWSLETSIS